MDQREISAIVETVVARLRAEGKVPSGSAAVSPASGVFDRIEDALAAAREAQPVWAATSRATKTKVIDALRAVMHAHAEDFARREWEETGMGRVADKITKVHNAANATPGLEDLEPRTWTGNKGLVVEDYAPYGVVAAVTPSTHPVPVHHHRPRQRCGVQRASGRQARIRLCSRAVQPGHP
jgi:acyl-CoA reductase-like NAD-dependent aldehyde dehydrogenase